MDTEPVTKSTTMLPLTRIKRLMKLDEDPLMVREDAVIAMTKATELFIQYMTMESMKSASSKDKLSYKAVADTVASIPALSFLEEVVPAKVTGEFLLYGGLPTEQQETKTND